MKKAIISLFILFTLVLFCSSCGSSRRYNSSLEGLMLQENTRLRINRAYYSHHNIKTRKDAYRKFRKYGRR
ncbi:MAG TPA: hypothetical protein VK207_00680 [Bacteroidales bacterium]|nr:hypothetical protein [Bacteroidales bacterium]